MSATKKTASELLREYNETEAKLKNIEGQVRTKFVTIITQSPYKKEKDFPTYGYSDSVIKTISNGSVDKLIEIIDLVEQYHESKANIVQGNIFK